jgi:AcrR family transcriptional regulator
MRDAAHTKELIAETALRLFVEKGIKETTIRDIAKAAGIAEGTLYRHYSSKDDLAWELFSKNFMSFTLELNRVQQGAPTLQAKIDAMIRYFCTFFDTNMTLVGYLLIAQHSQLSRVTPTMPRPGVLLRGMMAEAMDRGEIPKADPEVAASMVLGLVLEVAISKMYGYISEPLSSVADTLSAASWRVLQG